MYQSYFGLKNPPFSIVPDHRVVYMSESHRDAVAHLLYSLKQSGGFVQLTGEVGTGKTTVCRYLLEHLPDNVDVALLLNPRIDEKELIETICDELHIPYPEGATLKQLLTVLNKYLLDFHGIGRHTVLIIDEAQNLSREVLEQVRLLTNLETSKDKLLQIILIGQPELVKLLNRHDLRQLSQRIVGRFTLKPLTLDETREYINYRLLRAGCERSLFTLTATRLAHKLSGGIPRVINVLCDTALMGAYSQNKDKVTRKLISTAAAEIFPGMQKQMIWSGKWLPYTAIASVIAVLAIGLQSTNALPVAVTAMKSRVLDVWQYKPVAGPSVEGELPQTVAVQEKLSDTNGDDVYSPNSGGLVAQLPEKILSFTEPDSVGKDSVREPSHGQKIQTDKSIETGSRFDLVYRLGVPLRNN